MEDDNTTSSEARWDPYFLARDEALLGHWQSRVDACGEVLFIVGHGFDPRVCEGLRRFQLAGLLHKTHLWVLDYGSGTHAPNDAVRDLVEKNRTDLANIAAGTHGHERLEVTLRTSDGRRVGARNAAGLIAARDDLLRFSDIVVDISALPRTLYFPIIGALLHRLDLPVRAGEAHPNLHVLVAESSSLDRRIQEEEVEPRADYLHGFTGGLDQESVGTLPTLWIPLLGERQSTQLSRIYDLVLPDEVCPVLPSPSADPRRSDNLVLEYRDLLFDRLRIEPTNVLYAAEQNPFEVYRQLRRTVLRYEDALSPIGGCKTAISVLSSKLMSVGALLAAYEMKSLGHYVGIAHVEANAYSPGDPTTLVEELDTVHLFGLWLAGESYAL